MSEAKKSGLRDVIELVTKAEELIKDYCRELKLLNQWQLLMVQKFFISSMELCQHIGYTCCIDRSL